ncbi:MAG: DUF2806 domain-containing protein [Gammaproteobacteria bacterium]|nr:DUF2806 domain-containing protein [Gammaproteobacteria bacterium]
MEFPGEKLVIRLWDTVERGLGGLLRPWQIRRTGRARIDVRREEQLKLAQTEQDIQDIQSGRKIFNENGQVIEVSERNRERSSQDESFLTNLVTTAQKNLISREMRSEVNVAKALLNAEADLQDDPQEPPDRDVDRDWLYRWRDYASEVSDAELQTLWGRVLAGEVKSPGKFSLRTLEFLRNLSKEEARQIEKLAPFVVGADFVFKGDSSILESEGITFGLLLSLRDLRILDPQSTALKKKLESATSDKFLVGLVAYGRVLVVTHEDAKREIELEAYRLTSLGKEVIQLGKFVPHEPYLRSLGRSIQNQGYKVVIARYEQVTETEGRYFDEEEL